MPFLTLLFKNFPCTCICAQIGLNCGRINSVNDSFFLTLMEGFKWLRKLRASMGKSKADAPNPAWPEWYHRYFELTQSKPADETLLDELPLVIIDVKTTGLNVKKDRLLSIGALQMSGNDLQLTAPFEGSLSPTPAPKDAQEVSRSASLQDDYREEEELMKNLLDFIGRRAIVGHRIGSKVEMINRALERLGAGPLRNRIIDTADLAKQIQPPGYWSSSEKYSLGTLLEQNEISLLDRDAPLGDVYITGKLWLKLKEQLKENVGRDLVVGDL